MNSASASIKYSYNIRSICKSYGFVAGKTYDEKYKKVRKILNLKWDEINDELWRSATSSDRQSSFSSPNRNVHIRNARPNNIHFREGSSNNINSLQAIAGPSVNQGSVKIHFVNSNISVSIAAKNIVQSHVQKEKVVKQLLPNSQPQ